MNLYILIATINERILGLEVVLQPYAPYTYYIISHQITENLSDEAINWIVELKKRPDVLYDKIFERGVAVNRNKLLKHVHNGIGLLSDDDVVFYPDAFLKIREAFNVNKNFDVITFKISHLDGTDYRRYPKNNIAHNHFTITGVGAVEIAFKIEVIKKEMIFFDEKFGPGAQKFISGEDYIFMVDILKNNIPCFFVTESILKHPPESTGTQLTEKIIKAKGAVFARTYSWLAFIINFLFAIKKYSMYKTKFSFFRYIQLLFSGSIDYLKGY